MPLYFDPNALRATRPKFATVSTQVMDALTTLRSALDSEGECWGSDDPGTSFAEGYVSGASECATGIEKFKAALEALGDAVVTTANTLEAQDQANADATDQVGL